MKYHILRSIDGGMRMMDWPFAVLIVFALALFFVRVAKHRQNVADYVILAVALGNSALILAQGCVSSGSFLTFWRYHYPVYALLIGYCGYGARLLCCGQPYARRALLILVACCLINLIQRPIRHHDRPDRYADESAYHAHCRAAELIRKDWTGPRRQPVQYTSREYVSTRAPLVAAYDKIAGYRAGGRTIDLNDEDCASVIPDYWLISDHETDFLLHWLKFCPQVRKSVVGEIDTGRERFVLYRTDF